jgi:uncharacterized membrane protein YedE/YeeE
MKRAVFLVFGALFGFLLSRARATDYVAIENMFLLRDLHLFGVIGVAIATAAVGLFVLRRAHAHAWAGGPVSLKTKPFTRGVFAGGLVFGVGWALSGACPGTALTQIGEGKMYALATAGGILLGTWLQRKISARSTQQAQAKVAHAS